jgi:hypothetical protein
MKALAAALLLAGVLRHYGWELLPPEIQALAWNISGAVIITILLWAVAWQYSATRLIVLWWTFEELQVIVCSLARMLRPWTVGAGEAQCSALLGFDLSTIGLLLISLILAYHILMPRTTVKVAGLQKKEKRP